MIQVIVAEDHRLVGESLRRILDSEEDLKCVGLASNGVEALEMVKNLRPDVAIVDVNMPLMDGIDTTRRIKADYPETAVLILTAFDYEEYVVACLEAGADGFVLKANLPCDGLVNAVRTVHKGRGVFDQGAVSSLRKLVIGKDRSKTGTESELCDREREVLLLAAKGMTSKQIAIALKISDLTVNSHFTNIFRKLNVQSRIEAIMVALKKGWISTVGVRES
jgi:two-component system, NarL family, response regulator LiaR